MVVSVLFFAEASVASALLVLIYPEDEQTVDETQDEESKPQQANRIQEELTKQIQQRKEVQQTWLKEQEDQQQQQLSNQQSQKEQPEQQEQQEQQQQVPQLNLQRRPETPPPLHSRPMPARQLVMSAQQQATRQPISSVLPLSPASSPSSPEQAQNKQDRPMQQQQQVTQEQQQQPHPQLRQQRQQSSQQLRQQRSPNEGNGLQRTLSSRSTESLASNAFSSASGMRARPRPVGRLEPKVDSPSKSSSGSSPKSNSGLSPRVATGQPAKASAKARVSAKGSAKASAKPKMKWVS
eukprot:TRINITY_DN16306_c3_g1_i1.p1 TRINITY_DN16306_c3_g1~~TRINITY_DN16306_c3_g1_i1.p1  ORF type:complete len:294 (-),score=83.57 TRINITY_DN16306_c3_g1_i1:50-931(-)